MFIMDGNPRFANKTKLYNFPKNVVISDNWNLTRYIQICLISSFCGAVRKSAGRIDGRGAGRGSSIEVQMSFVYMQAI